MAGRRAVAILPPMDRSLDGDDYRLLSRWEAALDSPHPVPAPALADLPHWFQQVVAEQAAWLGVAVPGLEA